MTLAHALTPCKLSGEREPQGFWESHRDIRHWTLMASRWEQREPKSTYWVRPGLWRIKSQSWNILFLTWENNQQMPHFLLAYPVTQPFKTFHKAELLIICSWDNLYKQIFHTSLFLASRQMHHGEVGKVQRITEARQERSQCGCRWRRYFLFFRRNKYPLFLSF